MDFFEKLISDFMVKFSKDIEIHLNPNLVSFYRGTNLVQFKPVIYISDIPKKPKVLAVGEGITPNEPHIKVSVFDFTDTSSKTDQMKIGLPGLRERNATGISTTVAICR